MHVTGHATADLAAVVESWRLWLRTERRLAERTQVAYRQDMASFLAFLAGHQGGDVALANLRAMAEQKAAARRDLPQLNWRYILFKWNDADEEMALARQLAGEVGADPSRTTPDLANHARPDRTFGRKSLNPGVYEAPGGSATGSPPRPPALHPLTRQRGTITAGRPLCRTWALNASTCCNRASSAARRVAHSARRSCSRCRTPSVGGRVASVTSFR